MAILNRIYESIIGKQNERIASIARTVIMYAVIKSDLSFKLQTLLNKFQTAVVTL